MAVKKKTKSKSEKCDVCDRRYVLQDGLCSNCAKDNDPISDRVIDRYFSDAKKGTLSVKGAAYLEGSLFVKVNGHRSILNMEDWSSNYRPRAKWTLKIAELHIKKILHALGTSNSINMFHPLMRWACKLHPKKYQNANRVWEPPGNKFFILFDTDKDLPPQHSRPMLTRLRSPAERKKIWSSEGVARMSGHDFKSERAYLESYSSWRNIAHLKFLDCGDEDLFLNHKDWPRPGKKLYNTAIKQIAKLEYESKYPELLEMLLLPMDIYNERMSPFKVDNYGEGGIDNGNLLAAEVLTAIGGEEVRDILVDITSSTWEACCKKYLSHIKSKEVKHIFSKMAFSGYASVHADFDDVKRHFEGIKNLATISLSKLPKKLSSDKKTLSVLLKRLESKDLVKRRHAAIALMDAVDEPDLEILWKVTRAFLEWERDRAKHLKEQYGGEYR